MNSTAPGGRGATTGGVAKGWADSIGRVIDFFGQHLKPSADNLPLDPRRTGR